MKFKPRLNLVIDALLALCLMAIAGIGFLIKFVLPPARFRRVVTGQTGTLTWLGMDRHEWGAIHFWLGAVFLALLVLHVVLHWRQVVALYRILIPHRRLRVAIAVVFVLLCVAAVLFPLFAQAEERSNGFGGGGRGYRGGRGAPAVVTPSAGRDVH